MSQAYREKMAKQNKEKQERRLKKQQEAQTDSNM